LSNLRLTHQHLDDHRFDLHNDRDDEVELCCGCFLRHGFLVLHPSDPVVTETRNLDVHEEVCGLNVEAPALRDSHCAALEVCDSQDPLKIHQFLCVLHVVPEARLPEIVRIWLPLAVKEAGIVAKMIAQTLCSVPNLQLQQLQLLLQSPDLNC
jgi:hypothetical protein